MYNILLTTLPTFNIPRYLFFHIIVFHIIVNNNLVKDCGNVTYEKCLFLCRVHAVISQNINISQKLTNTQYNS